MAARAGPQCWITGIQDSSSWIRLGCIRAPYLLADLAGNLSSIKKDIRKMLMYYDNKRVQRVFILFDANPDFVFLNERRKASLLLEDPSCNLFHYPEKLNSLLNSPADKAWATMNKKKAQALLRAKEELVQE